MRKVIILAVTLATVVVLIGMLERAANKESVPSEGGAATEETAPSATRQDEVNPGPLDASIIREATAAIDRAASWLAAQQNENGSWSNPEFPALTGLAIWALARTGYTDDPVLRRGINYILTCVHKDGSIYREPSEQRKGGGLSNYNTAICMVALHAVGDPELIPTIQKARAFVAAGQHFGSDRYAGGMGYDADTGRAYADLSNSYLAFEAMRLTEAVEDLKTQTQGEVDLDWEAAQQFIERIQNRPESNDQPWASDNEEQYGGFAYSPDSSQAGSYTNAEGEVRLRSYGSMTYAGLLSFIYAQVDRNDPRVQSAFDWTRKFWTLEENPGMGSQGLFYYYNVLAKALDVYGQDIIEVASGQRINWRHELIKKMLSLQKIDPATGHGYWVNDEGRWWEADPTLVTAYSLLALHVAVNE